METIQESVDTGSKNHPEPHPEKFEVVIIYNGVKKPVRVSIDESMKAVLDQAIALFGSLPNPHTLALFTEGNHELPITGTVKDANIKAGEKLLLRASAVRGG